MIIIKVIRTAFIGDFLPATGLAVPLFSLPLLTGCARFLFVAALYGALLRLCCGLPPGAGRPFGAAPPLGAGGLFDAALPPDTAGLFGAVL